MSYIVSFNGGLYDIEWLKNGCTDDTYFNWMYSLWTAQDDNIKFIINNNTAYRKFVSCGFEGCKDNRDRESHYKRFQLVNVNDKDSLSYSINHSYYMDLANNQWKNKISWVISPPLSNTDWRRVDRNKLFWNIYGSGPKFVSIETDNNFTLENGEVAPTRNP